MIMFIANCTQQVQIIHYQLPESVSPNGMLKTFTQAIEIGRQVKVNGKADLGQHDIKSICDHLCKYGMRDINKLDKEHDTIPLVFSIDRPVRSDLMLEVINHNKGVQIQRGKEARQRAALAVNLTIENTAATVNAEVPFTEVGIDEENQGSFADGPPLTDGHRIQKQPGESITPKTKRARNRAN